MKMNFLTGSVLFSFLSCIVFTVVVIYFTSIGIMIPDTLIQYFFMCFGIEFGATAAIKIANRKFKKEEIKDKIQILKEEGLPIEKSDIASTDSGEFLDYDDGGIFG